jgi:hypothetical protein
VQSAHPPAYQWVIDVAGLGVLLPDDTTAPVVSGPVPDIYGGHPPGDTTTAVRLRWTARDTTTAVQRLDMQMSVNGGAWKAMPTFGAETARIYELAGGRSYRFRVRAWDWAGNVSAWAYGPTFRVTVAQETHSAWRWSSGWSRIALAHASGGYVRITSTRGASARLTFRGRSVAIYGPKRPSLGLSAVYLDGVRVGTINQYAGSPEARATLFVRNGLSLSSTHSLRIKSLGARGNPSGGTRVAVDVVSVVR